MYSSLNNHTLADGSVHLLTFSELVQQLLLGPVARCDEEKALWFQHIAEGSHILLPLCLRVIRIEAYGIKSPLVNTDLKSWQLSWRSQEVFYLNQKSATVKTNLLLRSFLIFNANTLKYKASNLTIGVLRKGVTHSLSRLQRPDSFFLLYVSCDDLPVVKPVYIPVHLKTNVTEAQSLNHYPWLPRCCMLSAVQIEKNRQGCYKEVTTDIQEQRQNAGPELEGKTAQQRVSSEWKAITDS